MNTKTLLLTTTLLIVSTTALGITEELETHIDETNQTNYEILAEVDKENWSQIENTTFDIERRFNHTEYLLLELNETEINKLEEKNYTGNLEPNYKVETQLIDSNTQISNIYPHPRFTNQQLDIKIGVLDSGIANHTWLETEKHIDFTGTGIGDQQGHGTHVAGIIGSQHPYYPGVAPGANLTDLKVLGDDGTGSASYVIRAVEWSINNDMDILSMSLGTEIARCDGTDAISRSVRRAHQNGLTVVAAAGNSGPERQTIKSPGCAKQSLTVGAVNKDNQLAHYSSRGPTADGRSKPDVVAPGTQIASTGLDNTFRYSSGTSMAAPHVSGQAAILKHNFNLSNDETIAVIEKSAQDLGEISDIQGKGAVNIQDSYVIAGNDTIELPSREPVDKPKNIFNRLRQFFHSIADWLILRIG